MKVVVNSIYNHRWWKTDNVRIIVGSKENIWYTRRYYKKVARRLAPSGSFDAEILSASET